MGVKVQLPTGISSDDVALAVGPAGWTLAPTADGYEAGGPSIGPGVDLEYGITIGQLPPDATELRFKTLLTYSDGREDAWIELPTGATPDPEQCGSDAVGRLREQRTGRAGGGRAGLGGDGGSTGWIVVLASAAIAVLAGGLWFWRSRTPRGS